jgi:hypothetical protein
VSVSHAGSVTGLTIGARRVEVADAERTTGAATFDVVVVTAFAAGAVTASFAVQSADVPSD